MRYGHTVPAFRGSLERIADYSTDIASGILLGF